jgi:hypothetical protein
VNKIKDSIIFESSKSKVINLDFDQEVSNFNKIPDNYFNISQMIQFTGLSFNKIQNIIRLIDKLDKIIYKNKHYYNFSKINDFINLKSVPPNWYTVDELYNRYNLYKRIGKKSFKYNINNFLKSDQLQRKRQMFFNGINHRLCYIYNFDEVVKCFENDKAPFSLKEWMKLTDLSKLYNISYTRFAYILRNLKLPNKNYKREVYYRIKDVKRYLDKIYNNNPPTNWVNSIFLSKKYKIHYDVIRHKLLNLYNLGYIQRKKYYNSLEKRISFYYNFDEVRRYFNVHNKKKV